MPGSRRCFRPGSDRRWRSALCCSSRSRPAGRCRSATAVWCLALSADCSSASSSAVFVALDYTTVSRASVFLYTMPFWVALAAHFLIPGERLTPARITGLVLAFAGVAWALLEDGQAAGEYAFYGDLACIVAAILWAGIALLVSTTDLKKSTPVMQLLYQLAVSSVVLLPVSLLFGDLVRDFTPAIGAMFASRCWAWCASASWPGCGCSRSTRPPIWCRSASSPPCSASSSAADPGRTGVARPDRRARPGQHRHRADHPQTEGRVRALVRACSCCLKAF